jgi:AraC family transcriptional regulator, melibiose operon regulatory protein
MNIALKVYSDLSEKLNYNRPDFPLYVRKGILHHFDNFAAACHWHLDLEFILILEGSMEYFINGETICLNKGNGIFVNSKRMHYGFSTDKNDCTFIVIAVHPTLLGESTAAGKIFIEDKFGVHSENYIYLSKENQWQKELLELIYKIYNDIYSDNCNILWLLSYVTTLCAYISSNIKPITGHVADDQDLMALWNMTGFIHKHYDTKINLNDISSAGVVCRSKCCEIFNKYIGQTPNTYLMRYRIQKSCEMLRESNSSICEIAISCGFQSASYFTYVFRKEIGSIPIDYRRNKS